MNRKFGIAILVLCFGLSGVNAGLASQAIEVSPIIVQPSYNLRGINQQTLEQGRVNRGQELVMINSRQESSQSPDVIALIKDVNAMKDAGRLAKLKKDSSNPAGSRALSDEQAKDDTIRWLNQVVVVAKKKAEYYRLTSQQDHLTMEKVQEEAQQTVARLDVQLSQKQQQVDLLKSELENKITEANNQAQQEAQAQQDLKAKLQDKENQITAMKTAVQSVRETQAQSDAHNQELQQVLLAKNDQAQMEKQIAYLNAQLQEKEAQVVKIKKEMYDLQESMSAKDRDLQAKNLSLSIELASARQKLNGMPGSDETNFLRTGLQKATAQLKQKDEMLSQNKANADEYVKELSGLQKQVTVLTQKLEVAEKKLRSKTHENEVGALEAQLRNANLQIKDLRSQLNQLNEFSKGDRLREKLKQALDKIDEQGRMINVLAQKLQDAGQNVNLTQHFTKS